MTARLLTCSEACNYPPSPHTQELTGAAAARLAPLPSSAAADAAKRWLADAAAAVAEAAPALLQAAPAAAELAAAEAAARAAISGWASDAAPSQEAMAPLPGICSGRCAPLRQPLPSREPLMRHATYACRV